MISAGVWARRLGLGGDGGDGGDRDFVIEVCGVEIGLVVFTMGGKVWEMM